MHPKNFQVLTVVLQYSLLAFILYFLFRTIQVIQQDISQRNYEKHYSSHAGNISQTKSRQSVLKILERGQFAPGIAAIPIQEEISIGRGPENNVVIPEAVVSHEHACISRRKQEYWLTDLSSTNGTYYNGMLLSGDVLLKHQDIIKVGSTTFRFEE
ncbi:FHA domain-containing protein [Acetonema longum]|uniref:FHA domain-containing protein n=1 Tax=Acetonema longum DSM 6540 TaxID=1009370 RepID=F7NLE9_9FIRM|nr:FHA domain-containing protein [Acetonema longum]EGO63254.1 FHA domain-containing protein [Acetonema longum DSM 6540]